MHPQIKDPLLFAEKIYDITHYALLGEIVLDVLQGILLDLDTTARSIHANAFHETKLTLSKMRANLKYVFAAISTLNKDMLSETRAGQFDKAYISDVINDYIRCFSPSASYTDETLETLLANTTTAFEMNKRSASHREEYIRQYAEEIKNKM